MSGEWIRHRVPEGDIRAFAVRPADAPPWPALILVHGINGCGPHMEDKAAEFAAAGYFAVAPDIYSNDPVFPTLSPDDVLEAAHLRAAPATQAEHLARQTPERRAGLERALAWAAARPPGGAYLSIVRGCFDALRARSDVAAIGCIGYCMGGRLTGELAASGADLAAAVICYGGHPKLELVPNIRCPIEGHYAATDRPITDKVPAFAAAMKAAGKSFTSYVYDADHGFSLTPGTAGYDEAATLLSMQRIVPFLDRKLKAATLAKA